MSIILVDAARTEIDRFNMYMHQFVCMNKGLTNAQLNHRMRMDLQSNKQFLPHFTNNHVLYPMKMTKRICAEYYPTKKNLIRTPIDNGVIVQNIHICLANIVRLIGEIIRAKAMEHDLTCCTDLSKQLRVFETTTGNHKGWFVWELVEKNKAALGFTCILYKDMTPQQKARVVSPHGNKKYYVPHQM